jgi:hypothetical protein
MPHQSKPLVQPSGRGGRPHPDLLEGRFGPSSSASRYLNHDASYFPCAPTKVVARSSSGGGVELGRVAGLTKMEAEDWLDWLEAQGCRYRAVAYDEGQGFVVRYSKEPRDGSELRSRSRAEPSIRPLPCEVQSPVGWGKFSYADR